MSSAAYPDSVCPRPSKRCKMQCVFRMQSRYMPSGHCVPLQSGEMQNDAFSACEQKKEKRLLAASICHKIGSLANCDDVM